MKKLVRSLFIIMVLVFILSALIFSRIPAQQSKVFRYTGDFCYFNITLDYELDYKNEGKIFTYTIYPSGNREKKLVISNGHTKMDFKLPQKEGYKVQIAGPINVVNTQGVERKGVTDHETHWREAYLYCSTKGGIVGTNCSLIYVYYDDVDGSLSQSYDQIISSIEIKDPLTVEVTPKFP